MSQSNDLMISILKRRISESEDAIMELETANKKRAKDLGLNWVAVDSQLNISKIKLNLLKEIWEEYKTVEEMFGRIKND